MEDLIEYIADIDYESVVTIIMLSVYFIYSTYIKKRKKKNNDSYDTELEDSNNFDNIEIENNYTQNQQYISNRYNNPIFPKQTVSANPKIMFLCFIILSFISVCFIAYITGILDVIKYELEYLFKTIL